MRIKKAQLGQAVKKTANAVKSAVKKASSNTPSKGKYVDPEFNQNFITKKPSGEKMRNQIKFDYTGKKAKYKAGGKMAKAKSGKSFPDLTGDGKVTRADILKGRGVIKNGGKLKKARGGATLSPSKKSTSSKLASYGRPIGKNLSGKLKSGGKVMKMGGKCRGGCY